MQAGSIVNVAVGLNEMATRYKSELMKQLEVVRSTMSGLSANDDRFHDLSAERDEIVKLLTPIKNEIRK